jgi:hypothetical protein
MMKSGLIIQRFQAHAWIPTHTLHIFLVSAIFWVGKLYFSLSRQHTNITLHATVLSLCHLFYFFFFFLSLHFTVSFPSSACLVLLADQDSAMFNYILSVRQSLMIGGLELTWIVKGSGTVMLQVEWYGSTCRSLYPDPNCNSIDLSNCKWLTSPSSSYINPDPYCKSIDLSQVSHLSLIRLP